ncbi:hypothetical protein IJG14_08920 [bacterium]|nr:hypothetical protein [bacterium]
MKRDKIFLVFVFVLVAQLPAHAYLDPGTGSLVIQVLIASLAAVGVWAKSQWNNIKGFFGNIWKKK